MSSEHNPEELQQLEELEKVVRFNRATVGIFAVTASLNVLDYGIHPTDKLALAAGSIAGVATALNAYWLGTKSQELRAMREEGP
jgi:hypothetical protein